MFGNYFQGFPRVGHTYTNITPFTNRDGMTYLETLENFRYWIYNELVPHLDKEMAAFKDAWSKEVADLIAAVDAALTDAEKIYIGKGVFRPDPTGLTYDGKTDWRAAINAASLEAENAGGGTVELPAGLLYISYALAGRNNVRFQGRGIGKTIIKLRDGNFPNANNPSNPTNFFLFRASSKKGVELDGITWDGGTGHTVGVTATVSVAFNSTTDVAVTNCEFKNTRRSIYVSDDAGVIPTNYEIARNRFDATTEMIAIDVSIPATTNNFRIYDNVIDNVLKDVINGTSTNVPVAIYYRGTNSWIYNNTVRMSLDTAIMVTGVNSRNIKIYANDCASQQVTIYYGRGATYGQIMNNQLTSLRDYGIALDGGIIAGESTDLHCQIIGNEISNPGKAGIGMQGVSHSQVLGNHIINPGAYKASLPALTYEAEWAGIYLIPAPIGGGGENMVIDDNYIVDDRDVSVMSSGLFLDCASAILTLGSGNVIQGARNQTIYTHPSAFIVPPISVNNRPPKASFTWIISGRRALLIPAFTDTDGTIATADWSYGDNLAETISAPNTATAVNHYFARTAARIKNYPVRAIVKDDKGGYVITKAIVPINPLLADGFGTADSNPLALGSTEAGTVLAAQQWRIVGGGSAWNRGIAGMAKPVSGSGRTVALINPGGGLVRVLGQVGALQVGSQQLELIIRAVDENNYLAICSSGGSWAYRSKIAGVVGAVESFNLTPAVNDIIEIVDDKATGTFRVWVNNVLKLTKTTNDLIGNLEVGMSGAFNVDPNSGFTLVEVHAS